MKLEVECFLYLLLLLTVGTVAGQFSLHTASPYGKYFVEFAWVLLPLTLEGAASRHMESLLSFEKYASAVRQVHFWLKQVGEDIPWLEGLPNGARHFLRGDFDQEKWTPYGVNGPNQIEKLHLKLEEQVSKKVNKNANIPLKLEILRCTASVHDFWAEVVVNESSRSTPKMIMRVILLILLADTIFVGLTEEWIWGALYGFVVGSMYAVALWAAQPFRAAAWLLPKAKNAVQRHRKHPHLLY